MGGARKKRFSKNGTAFSCELKKQPRIARARTKTSLSMVRYAFNSLLMQHIQHLSQDIDFLNVNSTHAFSPGRTRRLYP
jgi:hypothetical protein